MLRIADKWTTDPGKGVNALYHFAGSGDTNWADFAQTIMTFSGERGGPTAAVTGVLTTAYPTPARRPANSRLDSTRFARTFGYSAPDWRISLEPVVARLISSQDSSAEQAS